MKRYIEVIFDNSYSMMTMVANKQKHEHAKQIFKDVVLPFLDFNSDDVAFRYIPLYEKWNISLNGITRT